MLSFCFLHDRVVSFHIYDKCCIFYVIKMNNDNKHDDDDDDDDDNNNNNNNNSNNNNNFPETRKYWADVQQGIVSFHGERDPF